jgi:hypothetical protein
MNDPELEAYAIEIDMMTRAPKRSDDRLRQNIMAFLAKLFEDEAA